VEISSIVKKEKNTLTSNSVWLSLLEINIPSTTDVIRLVSNNDDIVWKTFTWNKFPFELDEISQSSNAETSQFQIKVANVNNIIGRYIREYDVWIKANGFTPITVTLYILNSKDLANDTPVFSTNLVLASSSINAQEVSFTVSSRDLFRARTPQSRMFPNNCRFTFKDTKCAYAGIETECDKTLKTCRLLGNAPRFGGFATIGNKGINI